MENNFKMSKSGFWVPVKQPSSPPAEDFVEGKSLPQDAHPSSADPPPGRAGASTYRMSELGFWVPVEQASSPPVEAFGETRGAPRDDERPARPTSSDPPTGKASIYRMSESGFWVPVEQTSSTPSQNFREARREPHRDKRDSSDSSDDEAAEGRLLKELRWMRRYVTDPTLPPHERKRLRQMEDYVCQAIDAEIRELEHKAKLRKYREARAEARLEKFRAWVEEEHPRDEFGRFTNKDLERRAWWQRKWLAEAAQLLAQRERSGFRQFFGADMHGPPTAQEELLRRKAARVMDTKNWILDESGNLHSMARLAAMAAWGLSPRRDTYTGPAMRAATPADKEGEERYAQRQKELEREERSLAAFQRTLHGANPTYQPDWNVLERDRLRQVAEDAKRFESKSMGEKVALVALEQVLWGLATAGVGEFLATARLGGRLVGAEEALNSLHENAAAVERALARGFESEVGRSITAEEWAQLDTAWKQLLPEVEGHLKQWAAETSRLPESYINRRCTINMEGAPAGSARNAAGFPRNARWFWRQMLSQHPELFSEANAVEIRANRPPVVDEVWVKANPAHQSFLNEKLIHHHIDQGAIATGIPERIHHAWHRILHPD